MKKSLPLGRAIMALIAVVFLGGGVYFLKEYLTMRSECVDAANTELASFPDAFASPGNHSARFCPKYSFTCHEMLLVQYDPPSPSWENALELIKGLSAQIRVSDGAGNIVFQQELTTDRLGCIGEGRETKACRPGFLFRPVAIGDYTFHLEVRNPAPHLAGVPHRVVLKYDLCGLEGLATTLLGGISIGGFLVGGCLVAGIAIITRRKRRGSNSHFKTDPQRRVS